MQKCNYCNTEYDIVLLEATDKIYSVCPVCETRQELPEELKNVYTFESYSDTP